MKKKSPPTENKIRVHIKPGLDVFVNDVSEVKKVLKKYEAHTTIVNPPNDINYGFKETE